jgi:predicted small lipoprotein YifL
MQRNCPEFKQKKGVVMKKITARQRCLSFMLLLSVFLIAGCGGGGDGFYYFPDTTKPTVTLTVPANAATGIAATAKLTATFSEAMDPSTITATTFTVKHGVTAVAGTVSYSGVTATFTPASALLPNTIYTATITTGVKDLAGNVLAGDHAWSFTTATSVTLVFPAIAATSGCVNKSISATFSNAMDPSTITTATFTVATGVTGVPGTVVYNAANKIATFTPNSDLAFSTPYTATITTGVKDLTGTALAENKVWNFTTGAALCSVIAPVNLDLGAAAPFGTFGSGAGITNSGINTIINGDLGTTGASTLITGFHDSHAVYTQTTSNIGAVTGTIYTATAPPGSVPGVIAAAGVLAAQTAFDNLAPAALPGGIDVSTISGGAGELGGRTLAPGVYKSAPGTYGITLGDLTLDAAGDPNAVWVFQMATTLTVGIAGPTGARSVNLINGAQAKNVFWQVGSAATINAAGGGTMAGTILSYAATSISTAGNAAITTLEGRALSLSAVVSMVNTHINVPAP